MDNNYNFLVNAREDIFKMFIHGSKLNEIYDHAVEYVKKEKPSFMDNFTNTFGFAMGIGFRESYIIIISIIDYFLPFDI